MKNQNRYSSFTAHLLLAKIHLLTFFAVHLFAGLAFAASLELTNEPSTGGPGKFAEAEIRREAAAKSTDAQITLTVEENAKAAAQSYRILREGQMIRVIGADTSGAMYGGLDITEAIRIGTLDTLKSSENKPHIEKRGIKFNIPLDLRTPSYTDCSDAAQANIPEVWESDFWIDYLDAMARNRYNVPGANVLCIREWRKRLTERTPMIDTTSLEIAEALDRAATETFTSLAPLRQPAKADPELQKNLNDTEALARLGRYYAAKIRGSCALALFDANSDPFEHTAALRHLTAALAHWKNYAKLRDTHYLPALYNRLGYVDITAISEKVAADIEAARTWHPRTLKDDGKRGGAEKGFRK